MDELAILIPTRNRPEKLRKLLKSLSKSSTVPNQVVVVASGEDVKDVILEFESTLSIDYLYTENKGQIIQKKLGVALIRRGIKWCLFIDDDLLIAEDALQIALATANAYEKPNVVGIGLSLPATSRSLNLSPSGQHLSRLVKLLSREPGRVLSSGHATSYLQEKAVTETEWLNGVSIWRVEYAVKYGQNLPSTTYAACEDLIFSYPLSKSGTLIYVPEAKVQFQSSDLSKFDEFSVMQAASLWRYFFVRKHQELSVRDFLIAQVFRSAYSLFHAETNRIKLGGDLFCLNLKIIFSHLARTPPEKLLKEI